MKRPKSKAQHILRKLRHLNQGGTTPLLAEFENGLPEEDSRDNFMNELSDFQRMGDIAMKTGGSLVSGNSNLRLWTS